MLINLSIDLIPLRWGGCSFSWMVVHCPSKLECKGRLVIQYIHVLYGHVSMSGTWNLGWAFHWIQLRAAAVQRQWAEAKETLPKVHMLWHSPVLMTAVWDDWWEDWESGTYPLAEWLSLWSNIRWFKLSLCVNLSFEIESNVLSNIRLIVDWGGKNILQPKKGKHANWILNGIKPRKGMFCQQMTDSYIGLCWEVSWNSTIRKYGSNIQYFTNDTISQ